MLRRSTGQYETLRTGGIALGMFDSADYESGRTLLGPGDVIVMYSDGVTEAENIEGQPFDEAGLQHVMDGRDWASAKELGWATFAAVEQHSRERKLLDDLTVLVLRRLPPKRRLPASDCRYASRSTTCMRAGSRPRVTARRRGAGGVPA